ncbi:hypothetical protein [Pseudaquabacterium rugosum]|uniref:Helix-turn-helix domain-containing protein n=1 Tax=Pseudaquabacterium rugosum TaxID=2984194 RepID=A0ABU9BBE8_9BURK
MGRTVRTVALSRHSAPDFVMVAGLELMQLRKLGWLARVVYIELLAMADHATGRISTSYAVLEALADFDQAPGAHSAIRPTAQRLRTALDELVSMRLVTVDRIANEKRKGLFLRVATRVGISAPAAESNRRSNRPEKPKKQAATTVCTPTAAEEQQTEQQGVQEEIHPPNPPPSTAPGAGRAAARALLARVRGAGGIEGPQGGQSIAPAGHAPRGLRPPASAQADASPAEGITSPPRGEAGPLPLPPGMRPAITAAGLQGLALECGSLAPG